MIDPSTISWMEAEKAGISRRDWCLAIARKRKIKTHRAPKRKSLAKAQAKTIALEKWSCTNRGDVVGQTTCSSCAGGKRPLDIFECSIHGDCTIDKMPDPDGVKVTGLCKLCKDRVGKPLFE